MGDRGVRRRLLAGTAALATFHLFLSSRTTGPWVSPDEAGYLGNARWLIGDQHWPMPDSPAYSAGYSVLVAPIMAITHDPHLQWRLIVALNAVLLALLLPLAHAFLHRVMGVPARAAIVPALVGALAPAALATGYSGVSENLALPLTIVSVLAAWAMARPGAPMWTRVWLGPTAAVLYAAHPRFALALPATAVLIIGAAALGHLGDLGRRVAAANLAGLTLVTGATVAVNRWLLDQRWASVQHPEGTSSSTRALLTSASGLRELFTTAAGQAWYLLAGTFGLTAIGVALTVLHLSRPARLEPMGADAPEFGGTDRRAQRVALAYLLAVSGSVFAISVVFFAQNQFRLDHFIYGRHNDTFTPIWLALAVTWLIGTRSLRIRLTGLALAAVPLLVTGLVVIHERDPMAHDHQISSFSVPALLFLLKLNIWHAFVVTTVAALAGLAIGFLLLASEAVPARRLRTAAIARACLVLALVSWFGWMGNDGSLRARLYDEWQYQDWHSPADVTRLGLDDIWIDGRAGASHPQLTYPFFLPGVRFHTYDAERSEPAGPVVLARFDDPRRIAAGDRMVLVDQGFRYAVWDETAGLAIWVARGPEQRRLAARGRLLPAGFPATPLPRPARAARLRILDDVARPLRVTSGGRVVVRVSVTHRGTGSPWPDHHSMQAAGRVRIVPLITALDPGGAPGARSGGELERWMLPGDTTTATVQVVAVGQLLQPLPPGRYRVELALTQEGQDWLTRGGAAATFELVVSRP